MKYPYIVNKNGILYSAGEEVPNEEPAKDSAKTYSKSDISRMSTADLKTLAPTLGIDVTEESTGAKLKEEIITKLGL